MRYLRRQKITALPYWRQLSTGDRSFTEHEEPREMAAVGRGHRLGQILRVSPQEQIAEDAIRAALARGEEKSEELRDRRGKPIDLDAHFATPPELRMAFAMLKGADVAPVELEILKEVNRLEEQLKSAVDEKTRSELRMKISELGAVYDMKMQAFRRGAAVGTPSPVKATLKGALDR
jgi:hypothetical protein